MRVEYRDNPALGPGNGILIFSEIIVPEGPWSVAIQRASDQCFLTGKQGKAWVGETVYVPLKGKSTPEGALELLVGPRVVDNLDPQEGYRIWLKGGDDVQQGRLRVNLITATPAGRLGNTASAPDQPDEVEPETPDYPPAPELQETAQTVSTAEPLQGEEPGAPVTEGQPAEQFAQADAAYGQAGYGPDGAAPQGDFGGYYPPAQPKRKSGLLWVWILLLILLLGGGAAGGWYYYTNYYAKSDEPAETEEPKETASADEPAKEQPAAEQPPAAAAPAQSAEEQTRLFFNGRNLTAEEALALAARLPRTTATDQDAIYRLYYFASEQNDPAGIMAYATCLDPSGPAWGSIQKDGALAYEAYEKAAQKGVANAAEAAQKLKSWLESAAATDAQAKIWLRQISQ